MSTLKVTNLQNENGTSPAITISVGGTVTVSELTSESSTYTGIVTAQSGINVTGGDINIGTGTSISSPANNELALGTNNTEQLRIDSSGNVGVGTSTPGYRLDVTSQLGCTYSGALRHLVNIDSDGGKSYWYNGTPTTTAYVIGDTGSAYFAGNIGIGTAVVGHKLDLLVGGGADGINVYNNATGAAYYQLATTSRSYKIEAVGSDLRFYDNTGSAERVRIDSSGRLLVGTSTSSGFASARMIINSAGTDTTGAANLVLQVGETNGSISADEQIGNINFGDESGYSYAAIQALADIAAGSDSPGRLVFSTTADGASSPTERMRIANNGAFDHYTNTAFGVRTARTAAGDGAFFVSSGASSTSTGTLKFVVRADGDCENTNNSYAGISDVKLKENIVNAGSQWDDLKALQIRKYNFKTETGYSTHTQIGLIAQEVETVSPGLVVDSPDRDEEGNDLGTVTKSVNYSVLYMKAVKALQEAMERIEQLETEMAEVKTQLQAS